MEALGLHVGCSSIATLPTTAVDVVGALLIEVLDALDEGRLIKPVEELGTLEVTFSKFTRATHVEDEGRTIGTSRLDEDLGSEYGDVSIGSAEGAATERRGKECHQIIHINRV
jgi:hypothetical protein